MPGDAPADLEPELDRLYGLPLGEFTPARNDLAKQLRKAGDRDAAERIAALRRPPITVWALNQLARRVPEEVADLARAGEELVESQSAALGGGGDPQAFEAAQRHQREAVGRLTRTSRGLLEDAGHRASDQTVERVASSLRAASVDEEGRRLLERGRFEDDFEGAGLLALAGLAVAPSPPSARTRPARGERDAVAPPAASSSRELASERRRRREELAAARARVREAGEKERAARRLAERARKDSERARTEAERAERHAGEARADAERASQALEEARAEEEALKSESPTRK